jgi:hypothetical protein
VTTEIFHIGTDWSLSDKIAAIAIIVGFLQFVALILTVRVMVLTARRQLRAYISVDTCPVKDANGNEIANQTGVSIHNVGQTPAHDLSSWLGIGLHEYPLRSPLRVLPETHQRIVSVLNPGDQKTQIVEWPTDRPDPAGVKAGTIAVYLWGEVSYKDAFGIRRRTKFRFFQNWKAANLQRWAHYEAGNEAT